MNEGTTDHISTEELERYHLGQVQTDQVRTGIKAHLTHCRECADRMLAIERFIRLVRGGRIRTEQSDF